MVNLNKISNIPPEERIALLKRLKELDEEKIKQIEQEKQRELEELKKKSKALEDELSDEINESIEELTQIESKRLQRQPTEEEIIQQQKEIKGVNYDSLVDKLRSETNADKSNAYHMMKEFTQHQGDPQSEHIFNYESLRKIKSVVDKMKDEEDEFGYKKRMESVLDQAFDNIQKYDGDTY